MIDSFILNATTNDSINAPLPPVSICDDDDFLRKETLSPVRPRHPVKTQSTPATVSTAQSSSSSSSYLSVSSPVEASFLEEAPITQPSSLRVQLPSPRRPRLDPRYAARLASASRWMSAASRVSEAELPLPPGITRDRDSFIFRPTSIITCAGNEGDASPLEVSMDQSCPSPMVTESGQSFLARSLELTRSNSLETCSGVTGSFHSPSVRTSNDYGVSDRYIPSRATSSFSFNLWSGISPGSSSRVSEPGADANNYGSSNEDTAPSEDPDETEDVVSNPTTTAAPSQQALLNSLLRSELLRENDVPSMASTVSTSSRTTVSSVAPLREGGANFRYLSPRQVYQENIFEEATGPTAVVNSFSLMPVASAASQRLLAIPSKRKRRISKVPFKVLDAPALQDDFYLNLVDWSSQNVLAVGLGSCVYLWSACTSKVTKLCDLSGTEDLVTSVSWAQRGTHLAVGTNRGEVQLWDTTKCKRVRNLSGHNARVGTLAWTGPILASGSRDRLIYLRDVRTQSPYAHQLTNHKQEVCGLKWSYDEPAFLASGGNDNHLHVIDSRNPYTPVHQFSEHSAAVKAIAWSPHQHGLLASGGGTADRCIRFFNTLSGASLNKIDTGSQVCNLAWSQNVNEIVSTHGYSLNQIVVWRYPSMTKVVTLTGHTYRVLYLSMSPDGSTIVTGAGDETLRFWQVFPGPRSDGKESSGLLFPQTMGSVIR